MVAVPRCMGAFSGQKCEIENKTRGDFRVFSRYRPFTPQKRKRKQKPDSWKNHDIFKVSHFRFLFCDFAVFSTIHHDNAFMWKGTILPPYDTLSCV